MSAEMPKIPEPVACSYTMQALVPGGSVKTHAQMLVSLPAGTSLYTADQMREYALEAARQAMERGISVIQALRDSHCADTQGGEAVCMPDTITCDFVVAWNDAIEELRALIPQDPDHLAGVGNMVDGKDQLEERHG